MLSGKPNLVPAARNYTSVAAPGEDASMNYHAILIEKNNTGLHMIIVPENPDDYFDVYVQVNNTLSASVIQMRCTYGVVRPCYSQ